MSDTKQHILRLGEELIRLRGYNAFSYQDISQPLGIRNAAVHYHYPAKEQLAAAIVRDAREQFDKLVAMMQAKNMTEQQQFDRFLKIYTDSLKENKICLPASLGSDFLTLAPAIQEEVTALVETILSWLTTLLKSGRSKNVFSFLVEPRTKALMILTSLMAGLQIARITSPADFQAIVRGIAKELKP